MGTSETCCGIYIRFGNEYWERNHFDHFNNDSCHDCGIHTDGFQIHHVGCDNERCPKCGGQFISCGCCWEYCDSRCGNWEAEGCNKPHAGKIYNSVPKGAIVHKPVMINVWVIPEDQRRNGETMALKSGSPIIKDGVKVQPYIGWDHKRDIWYLPTKHFAEDDI